MTPAAPQPANVFLGATLLSLIDAVRQAEQRVVASGARKAPGQAAAGAPDAVAAEADTEAVHDFRVALRRLRTLLRPARRVWRKKRILPIADDLRVYARATGALRDEEVLRETLAALALPDGVRAALDAWTARRARQERACRAAVIRMLRDDVARAQGAAPKAAPRGPGAGRPPSIRRSLDRLAQRVGRKARPLEAEALGREAMDRALAEVRALASADPADGPAMHALRIRFKRLRYSAETFAALFGPPAERAAKSAAKMQKRLGQLHDADQALLRIGRARGLPAADRAAVIDALRSERARLVGKAAAELGQELETLDAAWPAPDAAPAA